MFNHKEQDAKEVSMDYTRGRKVDLIFDQLVGRRFASQFEYLADFGMIVIYNWLDGSPETGSARIQLSNSPVMHRPFVHSLSIYMMISRNVWQRFGRSVWIGLSRVK